MNEMKVNVTRRGFSGAILSGVAAALLMLQPTAAQPASEKPFRVVTTFTIIRDIAQNVAGDKAIVESIVKPGAEIHDYQPTPQDIVRAQAADLVLWNGFNLEREGRAERRRDGWHRADRNHGRPL
jgi:manganese/iron transport system substrate-binding protein